MNKLFAENGLLSADGKMVAQPLASGLESVFSNPQVKSMSEAEIRALGSNLSKMVGDFISERLQAKRDIANKFNEMNDAQFEAYLKVKYGDRWMLVTVTQDEMDRVRTMAAMSDERIREALEQGRKDREAAMQANPCVRIDPGLRFR